MKLVNFTCPGCGAQLNVDTDFKQAVCPFCNKTFPIDDEVQHLKLDGAAQAGYEFERGRQRAQAEARAHTPVPAPVYYAVPQQPQQPEKKHGCLWWLGMILLWVFFLPFVATYYIVRSKKLNRNQKIGIVAAIWILFILAGAFGGENSESETPDTVTDNTEVAEVQESEEVSDSFELVAGEQGEYGQEVTMSEGTDLEEKFFVYYVPGGTYEVKNLDSHRTQVSVYEGFQKGDNGYDEYTDTGDILVLEPDETGSLNVPEGWFIEIHEPTHISLTPVTETETPDAESAMTYELSGSELGEYGRIVVLNENTDMPVEKKLYKLPEGKYRVTTTNEKFSAFYIAKDEVGIEEGNEDYPEMLQIVGEEYMLTAGDEDLNGNAVKEVVIEIAADESIVLPTETDTIVVEKM